MKPFRLWMLKARTAEQETLASKANISRNYLYKIADGTRPVGAELASRIAAIAEGIRKSSKGRLPPVTRADLASVCASCEYAKKCLKRKK